MYFKVNHLKGGSLCLSTYFQNCALLPFFSKFRNFFGNSEIIKLNFDRFGNQMLRLVKNPAFGAILSAKWNFFLGFYAKKVVLEEKYAHFST